MYIAVGNNHFGDVIKRLPFSLRVLYRKFTQSLGRQYTVLLYHTVKN